ncbi:SPOR domain-containing protein [Sphingosinicella terrae]|uniref:SPOR domain-containing protein n=1 Tax=Sphingosinicella terrae TaxID=2172047 RepID=UPI0013B36935|nr:SPOR domain-containing protein [Sphingosinicella terrae]
MMRGVRRSLALLAAGTAFPGGAAAQSPQAQLPPGAIVQPLSPDGGAELRGHLVTLAQNPRSVDALVGAGRAALRSGDAQAALTFFGRANEISRSDARVRAGIASALVHLGEADTALTLFAEAVGLGAPEVEIASERGLAHELVGDVRRAQQDYMLVLRRGDDAEVRRRLALSLAISGRRDAALRLIDAQLRANERAAWRTQAFILALTGDAAGATRTMQGFMPPADAQAMAPFLQRLAALNPAHKAGAVHLGYFPSAGQAGGASAQAEIAADPGALAFAMGGAPAAAPRTQTAQAPTADTGGRRRPNAENDPADRFGLRSRARAERRRNRAAEGTTSRSTAAAATSRPAPPAATTRPPAATPAPARAQSQTQRTVTAGSAVPSPSSQPIQPPGQRSQPPAGGVPASRQVEIAEVSTRWAGAPYPGAQGTGAPAPPTRTLPPPAQPASTPPPSQGQTSRPDPASSPRTGRPSVSTTEIPASTIVPTPGFSLQPSASAPASASTPPPATLADIAALVEALPVETPAPAPPAPPPPPPPARAAAARSESAQPERRAARSRRAEPAHPARHWVQIAGGANKAGLPREFARLRGLAPEQLNGRTAYTTPLRATNRLLVGPFASPREAQEFVNQLARHDVTAFAWTSEAGQEIERLPTGR